MKIKRLQTGKLSPFSPGNAESGDQPSTSTRHRNDKTSFFACWWFKQPRIHNSRRFFLQSNFPIYFCAMNETRLDKFITDNGFFPSREKSGDAIRGKQVKVNGIVINKPAFKVSTSDQIEIIQTGKTYVSKGGYKLEKALREFGIDFNGKSVLDAGASTGGFTDCALQHGASLVVAVDVGTNQLAKELRENEKVISLENTDIRKLKADQLPQPSFDIVVADLSFISLEKVLEYLMYFCKPGGEMVLLVKPQFELKQRKNLKNGIVKDTRLRKAAIDRIIVLLHEKQPLLIKVTETNIPEDENKNVEYLLYLQV